MAERKFTRGLHKPGMAAQLRESVSQVVRESAVLVSDVIIILLHFILNKNPNVIHLPVRPIEHFQLVP